MAFYEDDSTRNELFSYNCSVPFIDSLSDLLPHGITEHGHKQLVTNSVQYRFPFLATQMTRQVDLSGLVPNLADTCNNCNEVENILVPLAQQQIDAIQENPHKIHIFETLEEKSTTLDAIAWLDESLKSMIQTLGQYRGSCSTKMQQDAYRALRDQGGTITYFPTYKEGNQGKIIDYVTCTYSCPKLSEESKKILESLTPPLLKRGSYYDGEVPYPVTTPIGFLRQIGILGWPYLRALIVHIDQIQQTGTFGNDQMTTYIQSNP